VRLHDIFRALSHTPLERHPAAVSRRSQQACKYHEARCSAGCRPRLRHCSLTDTEALQGLHALGGWGEDRIGRLDARIMSSPLGSFDKFQVKRISSRQPHKRLAKLSSSRTIRRVKFDPICGRRRSHRYRLGRGRLPMSAHAAHPSYGAWYGKCNIATGVEQKGIIKNGCSGGRVAPIPSSQTHPLDRVTHRTPRTRPVHSLWRKPIACRKPDR